MASTKTRGAWEQCHLLSVYLGGMDNCENLLHGMSPCFLKRDSLR